MTGFGFLKVGSSTGLGSLKVGSSTTCVPSRGGLPMKPSMTMSTRVRRESQALITCLDVWKRFDIGVKPMIT